MTVMRATPAIRLSKACFSGFGFGCGVIIVPVNAALSLPKIIKSFSNPKEW